MIINWPKFVAKMVLYALLAAMVFMVIVWAVVLIQSNNSMQNLLDDLVLIVSEENCLSTDGGSNSTAAMFARNLEASETSWLTFDTEGGTAVSVTDLVTGRSCNSYINAPQRGAKIKCKLTGTVTLPVVIAPFGQNRLVITVPFEKEYNTMALKYFKDKA